MICPDENFKIILETRGYQLRRCLSCGIISAHHKEGLDVSPSETYRTFYKKETASRFGGVIEILVKMFRFKRAYTLYRLQPKAKSVLDIGSGRGWMLYFMRKYFGYESTVGTQISQSAYAFSKEKLQLDIHNKDLLEISFDRKFDVITMLHVLEHVEPVELYVEKIHELLNEKGFLFIEVPNFNSWTRKLTGEHWLALDLKHHRTFFTPSSLISLLGKYHLKTRNIRTFSFEYSTFTSAQSIVNYITNTDSYFFEWLQDKKLNLKIFWHILLFTVLFFPCLIINLCLYFSKEGEIITIIAQKI